MMAQYLEIKAANPDSLLFYRMGDFYELFFEDAETASKALGITLTKRGKHLDQDIPMCGVPYHASDEYLHRLIKLGYRVAVCEQTEDPAEAKKRGAKSVVRREVVRLVTAGTLTEENLLEAKQHNFLCCISRIRADNTMALAWMDISTGEFCVSTTDMTLLAAELSRLAPRELLVPESLMVESEFSQICNESGAAITCLPAASYDSSSAERRLKENYSVAALEAFGEFTRAEISACGTLVDYVLLTQVGKLPVIARPKRLNSGHAMLIDAATRTNLELTRTLSGEKKGSLLHTTDRTVTGPGGRLLAEWLSSPLTSVDKINMRLDAVEFFNTSTSIRQETRRTLKGCPDLGRSLARLSLDRGSPRDLAACGEALLKARQLAEYLFTDEPLNKLPDGLKATGEILSQPDHDIISRLDAALKSELPAHTRDGGFVNSGFNKELDENRTLRDESRKVIAGLQSEYCQATGIKALKIKHNNVLGYFIEVPSQHGPTMLAEPHDQQFIHRQTMASAMRFTTTELADLERRISAAANRAIAIEQDIFFQLVAMINTHTEDLSKRARAIAELDVYAGLAELADMMDYVRPLVDESRAFAIKKGRHPVVEAALSSAGESRFIANDCDLSGEFGKDTKSIWLLTGPNMAGKSTFLRQNALIALLAQTGSFVPADSAHIGIIDRLFSRVGAADDLARGRSTFMVEMVETATILNQATDKSLVILDEIGRGTATFDGLSIAWGSIEHLHEVNKSRALFATHYHELTALAGKLEHLANVSMQVREWKGEVIFLHEVAPGSADRSYGIQVARLAGLPQSVINRANEVLQSLEDNQQNSPNANFIDDLPLFSVTADKPVSQPAKPSAALARLAEIMPDELTPRQALDLLYELKSLSGESHE